MADNPEIEVQPYPTASTGFHSGVRRASSAVTHYVSFKEGTAKFDAQFAVFGHKTASDTKGGLVPRHISGELFEALGIKAFAGIGG